MSNLRTLRRRISAVESIQKITRAMEMVAAARLHKAQMRAIQSRPYAQKIKEILDHIACSDFSHTLFEPRKAKKISIVLVAADRGLCGAYNSNLFLATEKFIEQHSDKEIELILFGRKAIDHYKRRKWPIKKQITDWGGKISYEEIKTLAYELIDGFMWGGLDEVWLVYTRYTNIVSRKVIIKKLLNIEKPKPKEGSLPPNYIFEPSDNEVFSEILPRYCITTLQSVLHDAFASELGARITSMRAASKNADEMKTNLTLLRNKVRQTGITSEVLEITTGADSLTKGSNL